MKKVYIITDLEGKQTAWSNLKLLCDTFDIVYQTIITKKEFPIYWNGYKIERYFVNLIDAGG